MTLLEGYTFFMETSTRFGLAKNTLTGLLVLYSSILFSLLAANFKDSAESRATILMGATLFIAWVLVGGIIQKKLQKIYLEKLTTVRKHPIQYFVVMAIIFACIEEAMAVLITNLAPLYGVGTGQAYITASSNYFTVILLHSVIVFIPMFITLGFLLNRYRISPFQAFIIFGTVGVFAETMFAGPQALLNAPFWILVYGLMVYLPAHAFVNLQRKRLSFLLYPVLILIVTLSAVFTAWIPAVLNVPKTEFLPVQAQ